MSRINIYNYRRKQYKKGTFMTVDDIIKKAYKQLQEDPSYPNFWDNLNGPGEVSEMITYAHEGLLDLMKRTEINQTESTIPLYAQLEQEFDENGDPVLDPETGEPVFSERNFLGYYKAPINRIQKIQAVFWKPRPTLEARNGTNRWVDAPLKQLEVVQPETLDKLDPEWRTRETTGYPSHAVLWSGNYNTMNMHTNKNRNGMKIKLYPTPTDIDTELYDLISGLGGLESELDERRMSTLGGLMSDSGGSMVWGIDTNDDGFRDDNVIPGSSDLGILVNLLTGEVDLSQYGNYPIIRYIPSFKEDIFTDIGNVDGEVRVTWYELDNWIPYDLQTALKWYLCYRAFMKEGEAVDIKKSKMYEKLFEDLVDEYRAENYLTQENQKTSDVAFGFGRNNNRSINSNNGYGYYGPGAGYKPWY